MKTDPGEVFCAHGCGLPATMNVGGEDLCNECGHRMQGIQHDSDDEALDALGLRTKPYPSGLNRAGWGGLN